MAEIETPSDAGAKQAAPPFAIAVPDITKPKGGGAIRGIGEKFSANPVTGTGSMSVPIFTSSGRSRFDPNLTLTYDSGAGNGPFGFGWSLSIPSITRKTDKGLPRYFDADESDVFILSGTEDLVPELVKINGRWERRLRDSPPTDPGYSIQTYKPRVEGAFIRIERWTSKTTGASHWRSISRDNVTSFYGKREEARIADPTDPARIFAWLVCESYDDKGNAIFYHYKPESDDFIDPGSPWEKNRLIVAQFPQRYLKSIRYGNRTPRTTGEDLSVRSDWLFEVILDYGEHDASSPTTREVQPWPLRKDPFSTFRATFDVRSYRLCRRVLMFHHFPDELGGTTDYLVRSTDFGYSEDPVASFITTVTQAGYVQLADRSYLRKPMPALEFEYSKVEVDETVHEIRPQSTRNLPYGVDDDRYQWVDLDSEGLNGVLTDQGDAWYYKRNLGNGTFGPAERVLSKPSPGLDHGRQRLLDLAGEGGLDLVRFDGPMAGYFQRSNEGSWQPFNRFKPLPNIDPMDLNLRFVDVTGDGRADILVSEDTVFSWYESQGSDGFAAARRTAKAWDEERGPTLVFADPTQSLFIADMCGDGLADIVRVRYDDVCYWPNLGYGRFGAKVSMGNAPVLDSEDQFDARRVYLADIDGSGNADMVYVGRSGVSLHFNQCGNAWSAPRVLARFPRIDSLKDVTVSDLLGNGTACLVWSSPVASDVRQPMSYIDLMGGRKPHLMVRTMNNMGKETRIEYTASTAFYLKDRTEGRPWVTKLPFPVHVIERVESRDLVSGTTRVSTYRYRHGYFDGMEREFRGFAYVEQRDAESVVGKFDLPPAVTKTWFHTGAFLEEQALEAYFKDPANGEYFAGDAQAIFLPDAAQPSDLSYEEMREAARALKGRVLRTELFADDGTVEASSPYSVSESSYTLTCLQPQGPNRYAVFFAHPIETLDYRYERNATDPRIRHTLALAVDDFGNVLKSVAIGYARRAPAFDEQRQALATVVESQYTNPVTDDDGYRTPLPAEAKTYELTGPNVAGPTPLDFATVNAIALGATEIAYEVEATPGQSQKRLIESVRTIYRKNDLSTLLAFGKLESMALAGQSYKLALTSGLLDLFQPKASRSELVGILGDPNSGYRALDGGSDWWIASGQIFLSPNVGDSAQQELSFARAHFFLPYRFQDAFGFNTVVDYDAKYTLRLASTLDATGNQWVAITDYRTMQPTSVIDPNGNRTQARFDALGMLAGTAACGKAVGPVEGDSFASFVTDLTSNEISAFFGATDPRPLAKSHLGTATTRVIYDLDRVPACAAAISRESHVTDLPPGSQSRVQLHFVYSDGFGREAQIKRSAEAGPLDLNDPNSRIQDPRWISTGTKIYDNKGNAVREYEPFFSATPRFGIEKQGVSRTLFYDSLNRIVATLHPNHSFAKVAFDAWQETAWDVNDTVTFDPKSDADVGDFFSRLPDADYLPTWYQRRIGGGKGADEKMAAEQAAMHGDTPAVTHLDAIGRAFLAIADNGSDSSGTRQKYSTRSVFDIEGNVRRVIDPLERIVMQYDYDVLGARIHQSSMEAGERWLLNDAAGQMLRAWNSRDFAFRAEYDALRRPRRAYVQGGDPTEANPSVIAQEILFERTIYGDSPDTGLSEPEARQRNLRGKVFARFDGAGAVTTDRYDFKGNLLQSSRQFTVDYKREPDWSQSPALDSDSFTTAMMYDALNRATSLTTPDGSVYRPMFNEASLLKSVRVNLRNASSPTVFVSSIDYDAKGQRTLAEYGNGVSTQYEHDAETFRLIHLKTTRASSAADLGNQIFGDSATIQDLHYTFDPAGNIVRIDDLALRTVFSGNQRVDSAYDYTYDPLYRLTRAGGREHSSQSAFQFAPPTGDYRDYPYVGAAQLADLQALRNYADQYEYDPVGNFARVIHQAVNGNWTRTYAYDEASLIESTKKSNRLSRTTIGARIEAYAFDDHGSTTRMPHLPLIQWDFKDQLGRSARQVVNAGTPETTFYRYDAGGQRVRKITERQNGTVKNSRLYVGSFEIYREYDGTGGSVSLAREALHVMDDKRRVALVETKTVDGGGAIGAPIPAQRYEIGNHLGSACLEMDEAGGLISYEEYAPYGTTTFQAGRSGAEVSLKRYRYTQKERDEESGLLYHGARYYTPWLARWCSCDPASTVDGYNLYLYVGCCPTRRVDRLGLQGSSDELDAGVPPPALKAEALHLETEEQAKQNKADLPPGGAAPQALASQGLRPAETNKHANAWAARESKTGMKAGAVNAIATLSEGPLAIVPGGTPWGNKIRAMGPATETDLAQNTAFWTEFFIVTVVGEGIGEFAEGAAAGKSAIRNVRLAKPSLLRDIPEGPQLSFFPEERLPAPKLDAPRLATPPSREIPYSIDIAEVKSSNWSVQKTLDYQGKFIFTEGLDLEGGVTASVRYTPEHRLEVNLAELGGMERPIGGTYTLHLDPKLASEATQGLRFGTSAYGNALEPLAVKRLGQATGQVPVIRPPQQGGADFLPVQLGFRIPGYQF